MLVRWWVEIQINICATRTGNLQDGAGLRLNAPNQKKSKTNAVIDISAVQLIDVLCLKTRWLNSESVEKPRTRHDCQNESSINGRQRNGAELGRSWTD